MRVTNALHRWCGSGRCAGRSRRCGALRAREPPRGLSTPTARTTQLSSTSTTSPQVPAQIRQYVTCCIGGRVPRFRGRVRRTCPPSKPTFRPQPCRPRRLPFRRLPRLGQTRSARHSSARRPGAHPYALAARRNEREDPEPFYSLPRRSRRRPGGSLRLVARSRIADIGCGPGYYAGVRSRGRRSSPSTVRPTRRCG